MTDLVEISTIDGLEDGKMKMVTIDGHEIMLARVGDN